MLLAKKCKFFLYLNLIKISLDILLSDVEEKKETFFNFIKQYRTFSKGMLLAKKCHFFPLIRFEQNKTKKSLVTLQRRKKPFREEKTEFFKVQKIAFF